MPTATGPFAGVHVSIAGGLNKGVRRIVERQGTIGQIFTRSPRGWGEDKATGQLKPITDEERQNFLTELQNSKIACIIDHMPYLPNLATPENDLHQKSVFHLTEEIKRCDFLQIPFLVTHLGSHKGKGQDVGIQQVIAAIDTALTTIGHFKVKLLLENTAGGTNAVGNDFKEVAKVFQGVSDNSVLGLCFDTCHAFAAGYDLRTPSAVAQTLETIEKDIGLQHILVIHANDSKYDISENRDEHAHIGQGFIGIKGFEALIAQMPPSMHYIAETPGGDTDDETQSLDQQNIQKIMELYYKKYLK